jgi:hypothetical protein
MAAARSRAPSLVKMLPTWLLTVRSLRKSCSVFEALREMWTSTSNSRGESLLTCPTNTLVAAGELVPDRVRSACTKARNHAAIDPRSTGGDGACRVRQLVRRCILQGESGCVSLDRSPQDVVVERGEMRTGGQST